MLIDQEDDVMYDAKPISYIFLYDNNVIILILMAVMIKMIVLKIMMILPSSLLHQMR